VKRWYDKFLKRVRALNSHISVTYETLSRAVEIYKKYKIIYNSLRSGNMLSLNFYEENILMVARNNSHSVLVNNIIHIVRLRV